MDRKLILDFDRKQKQQKHHKSKSHGGKESGRKDKRLKANRKEEEEETTGSTSGATYRDRAKERREGLNKDFELDPDDLKISNPIIEGGQEIDEAERRRQQIEDSKYLGGDVEHTHLVKGVDFALLEKVKSAQKLAESKDSDFRLGNSNIGSLNDNDYILAGSDSDEEEFTREAIRAATATSSNKRQIDIEKLRKSDMIQCRTGIARRILHTLDEEKWQTKSELFHPGRMKYVFSLDEDSDSQVTTLLRSKAEQAEIETPVSEKDLAFDQLINIFAKIRNKKS